LGRTDLDDTFVKAAQKQMASSEADEAMVAAAQQLMSHSHEAEEVAEANAEVLQPNAKDAEAVEETAKTLGVHETAVKEAETELAHLEQHVLLEGPAKYFWKKDKRLVMIRTYADSKKYQLVIHTSKGERKTMGKGQLERNKELVEVRII
jgi:hypothetical protein